MLFPKPANDMDPVLIAVAASGPVLAGIGWLATRFTNLTMAYIAARHGITVPETHLSDFMPALFLMWAATAVITVLLAWFVPLPSGRPPRLPPPPRPFSSDERDTQ